jgi:hypothetical protein
MAVASSSPLAVAIHRRVVVTEYLAGVGDWSGRKAAVLRGAAGASGGRAGQPSASAYGQRVSRRGSASMRGRTIDRAKLAGTLWYMLRVVVIGRRRRDS